MQMDIYYSDAWHGHVQAIEQGNVSGTPTLVFPNGRSLHLELSEIPSEADSLEMFRAIEWLAVLYVWAADRVSKCGSFTCVFYQKSGNGLSFLAKRRWPTIKVLRQR